ncbi:MAG: zinc ribbon domain-containing protein [Planctomycetes bacterium]|nr:zinc ribbon domain-containing protein [Planctomycetota bacterium]
MNSQAAAPDIEFLDAPSEIDVDAQTPHGSPCEACGAPVEAWDKFCPACGSPQETAAAALAASVAQAELVDEETVRKFFRCEQCGAEVATDPEQRSYVCPFCDSAYVVEFARAAGRQPPEFVIGFAVTREEAEAKYRKWIAEGGLFRPGDLRQAASVEKLKGLYLPFWNFSMLAQSNWSATVGEYWYRTETYTTKDKNGKLVTRTRRVRETEWWPLSGRHHRYYSGYLVSGSRGLSQADADRVKPFQLPALARYEPKYLAGWLAEEYSIERDDALRVCQDEFYRREQSNVAAFLPGDTHRSLQVETRFSSVNSDLCLLPIYIFSYRYRDKLYRFLVNGQTGKVAGEKPLSWKRICAFVATVLLLIAIIAIVIYAIGGRI